MKNKMITAISGAVKLNQPGTTNEQEGLTTNEALKTNEPKNSLKDYETGAAVSRIFYFKKKDYPVLL